jgi:hypothetical protein
MKKTTIETYRNTLAVYFNMATDNISKWLDTKGGNKSDAIDVLKGENSKEQSAAYWEKAINNIYFIEWLTNNRRYFDAEENEGEISKANWDRLVEIINTLFRLRNYWTHVPHDEILLPHAVNELDT